MHRFLFLAFLCLASTSLYCQVYYQDLYNLAGIHQRQVQHKQQKILRVKVKSIEADGQPTADFLMEQQYSQSWSRLYTVSQAPGAEKTSLTNYFSSEGKLIRTLDSSEHTVTSYEYVYDSLGRVTSIKSQSFARGEKNRQVEVHHWHYGDSGTPVLMTRVRNEADTMTYQFRSDGKGNVTEESTVRNGQVMEKIFYYYDDTNRLTDIVRYNDKARKLLPDYMFSYDEAGRKSEMISVQQGGQDYLTWRYEYEASGLIRKETCFSKRKQLMGRLEYSYSTQR